MTRHTRSKIVGYGACALLAIAVVFFLAFLSDAKAMQEGALNPKSSPNLLFLTGQPPFDPTASSPAALQIGNVRLETLGSAKAGFHAQAAAYYIVQFRGAITSSMSDSLEASGAKVVGYQPSNAYIIRASSPPEATGDIRFVGSYGAGLKVGEQAQATIAHLLPERDDLAAFDLVVIGFTGEKSDSLEAAIKDALPGSAIHFTDLQLGGPVGYLTVTGAALSSVVATLAQVEGVQYVNIRQKAELHNDQAVRIIQSGSATGSTKLYLNGLTGAGQIYGAVDSGLDTDHAQFRLSAAAADQTLHFATSTISLIPGDPSIGATLPTLLAAPGHKVLTYYLLGGGNYVADPANPYGGKTLDPAQTSLNAVAYDDNHSGYHGTATTSVAVGRSYNATGGGALPGVPARTSGDGVAPDASVVFSDIGHANGSLPGLVNYFYITRQQYDTGVRVSNNSYGYGPHVSYDEFEYQIDGSAWYLRDFLPVFSAGNSGASGLGNTAKNCLTVAAHDSPTDGGSVENVFSFSSRGTTLDGRLKPDIAAPGVVVAATENSGIAFGTGQTSRTALDAGINPSAPNNEESLTASPIFGTSFSAPVVSGGAILARQYFTDGYYGDGASGGAGWTPSNALLKAVFTNSGQNMIGTNTGGPLPNRSQGWGRAALDDTLYFPGDTRRLVVLADILNGALAASPARHAKYRAIRTGEAQTYKISVTNPSEPLRVTLAFSDVPGVYSTNYPAVNDLDLEVVAPDGTKFHGNTAFTGAFTAPSPVALDGVNNVESVYVRPGLMMPGVWTIRVIGYSIPGRGLHAVVAKPNNDVIDDRNQGYALIATADAVESPTLTVTSVNAASYLPQHVGSPGAILAAFAPSITASAATVRPAGLPTTVDGVSIKINGILSPLFFVGLTNSATQINYAVPYATPLGYALAEIIKDGAVVASESLKIEATSPGLFTLNGSGVGQIAALNQDYSLNGPLNKAARGSYLFIYGTGPGGQFVDDAGNPLPLPIDGDVAPSSPLYHVALPASVKIGGIEAPLAFIGLAPGYVGLIQANALIPTSATVGDAVPITLTIGGKTSMATTVAIKP